MEYHGIKYTADGPGKWRVTYPSGYKGIVEADTEDELKAKFDELRAKMGTT